MNVIKIGNGLYAHEVTPENISQALALIFVPNDVTVIGKSNVYAGI